MNFTNWKGEFGVYDKDAVFDESDVEIINIADTMAGLTVIIDAAYELIPVEGMGGIYTVKKR